MAGNGRIKSFLNERFDVEPAIEFVDKQAHNLLPPHAG
jgi:hypothetical protein